MMFEIIKSKKNAGEAKLPGILYCHQGAGVMGKPAFENAILCRIALESDVVIFNLDYRLAPETSPQAALRTALRRQIISWQTQRSTASILPDSAWPA